MTNNIPGEVAAEFDMPGDLAAELAKLKADLASAGYVITRPIRRDRGCGASINLKQVERCVLPAGHQPLFGNLRHITAGHELFNTNEEADAAREGVDTGGHGLDQSAATPDEAYRARVIHETREELAERLAQASAALGIAGNLLERLFSHETPDATYMGDPAINAARGTIQDLFRQAYNIKTLVREVNAR